MKYYETSKFPKAVGSAGFYSIIAICLVAIGAITWFAVSRYNKASNPPEVPPSSSQVTEPPVETPTEDPPTLEPLDEPTTEPPVIETENPAEDIPYEEPTPQIAFSLPAGKQSKGYSDTELQYSATYGDMRLHTGVDIIYSLGSEVKATASGTVKECAEDFLLGKCIVIEHNNGITAKYCGFDTLAVSDGEEISVGRVLGTVGTIPSECADESHIHIEVKKDSKTVSPTEIN